MKLTKTLLCGVAFAISSSAIAQNDTKNFPTFGFSGTLKVDQITFFDKKDEKKAYFPSGGNLRSADIAFSGDVIEDFSYNISLSLGSSVSMDDVFISYTGLGNNTTLSFGQVPTSYRLEATTSGKWTNFMERSLSSNAFGTNLGVGINFNHYWDDAGQISASIIQPRVGARDTSIPYKYGSDRLNVSARGTYLPYKEENGLFHVGASAVYQQTPYLNETTKAFISDVKFSTTPEIKARATASLLDTGYITAGAYYMGDIEAAFQWNSVDVQAEYTYATVKVVPQVHKEGDYNFNGWHIEASWLLTGEQKKYDVQRGAFSKVIPNSPGGAWAIAARYSQVDLNDKDIKGGKERNVTLGVSWYVNPAIRVMANYIRAHIEPKADVATHRDLNIIGLRLQAAI